MSPHAPRSLPTAAELLTALERTGPRPVLAWYGEASRIELSGHVLANWVIKAIGHLHDEVALAPGDLVVLDLPPHWKRLVLALAGWSLGAEVVVLARPDEDSETADGTSGTEPAEGAAPVSQAEAPDAPQVLVTDRPDSALADAADEVLAVQPVSLAPRFDAELPPLVRDWVVEVRGSSDLLGVALPDWSGPAPAVDADGGVDATSADAARASGDDATSADAPRASGDDAPRLLVPGDGLEVPERLLAVLLAGGGLVGPAAQVSAHQAEEEGVTARA